MTTTQWQTTGTAFPAPSPEGSPRNGRATAGLVLSLVGLVVSWLPLFGFLVIGPALGISISGFRRARGALIATRGKAVAGIALSAVGSVVCLAMSIYVLSTAPAVTPVATAQSAPAPLAAPAPAPVLLAVPNVVGSGDVQARDALLRAGFTNVILGPSAPPVAGVAAGTVVTQLPVAGAQAQAGDQIVLSEAAAPPVVAAPAPVVAPQSAAPVPAAVVDSPSPRVDVDRPRAVTAVPRAVAAAPRASAPRAAVAAPRAAAPRATAPAPRASAPAASTPSSSGGSATYANCTAARNAGAAPLHRGQAGYSSKLDRDGDGVACE